MAPHILNFDTGWSLTPEKGPRYPLNRGLDGPQSQFGCFVEEKKQLVPDEIRIPLVLAGHRLKYPLYYLILCVYVSRSMVA